MRTQHKWESENEEEVGEDGWATSGQRGGSHVCTLLNFGLNDWTSFWRTDVYCEKRKMKMKIFWVMMPESERAEQNASSECSLCLGDGTRTVIRPHSCLLPHCSLSILLNIAKRETWSVVSMLKAIDVLDFDKDGVILSKEQKHFYLKNGYVVVPKLIDEKSLKLYTQRFQVTNMTFPSCQLKIIQDICSGKCPKSPQMALMRDVVEVKRGNETVTEQNLNKITNFMEDEVLWQYCQQPKVSSTAHNTHKWGVVFLSRTFWKLKSL